MIPKKPAPDLIRGENWFSEKIMLNQRINARSLRAAVSRLVTSH